MTDDVTVIEVAGPAPVEIEVGNPTVEIDVTPATNLPGPRGRNGEDSGSAVTSVDGMTGDVDLSGSYDVLGAAADAEDVAADALAAHVGASDPHPQYLTPTEGNAAYDAAGAAGAEAAARVAAVAAEASARASADTAHASATTDVHGIDDTSDLIVEGDARLADARTPTAHAASHGDGGSDEISIDASQVTSGTLADARIPAGVARDTEVTAAVSAEATARDLAIAAAIANLIASAPGALDTLNELAAALGGDPDFATTITAALAGKVPNSRTVNGHALSADVTVTKGDVGLGNVDNTADSAKTLAQSQITGLITALAGKLAVASDLADLHDAATARGNLGLGTAATHAHGDYDPAGTADAAIVSAAAAEFIRDTIGAALVQGAHIAITVSDAGDTITLAVTGLTTADLSDFATAVDERARDAVGTALTNGHGISITPSDVGDTITVAVSGLSKSDVGLGNVDNTADSAKTFTESQITNLTTDLAAKAPLASPTFTGTPAAPTASAGTNTTQLATTAFVKAAIDALLNGAPGALDTLKELADAINDDASFAATITAALALKAPLASPALTGTPTAPTATAGDNSTQLATTAFVQTAVASRKTIGNAAYTAGTTDATIYRTYSFTTALTASRIFTLPAASALPAGTQIRVEDGNNVVTPVSAVTAAIEIQIKPAGSDTVEGIAAATNFEVIRDKRGSVIFETDGVSDWKIVEVKPHTRREMWTGTSATAGGTGTNQYRKPLTMTHAKIRAIAGGGGGGGAQRNAVGSQAAGGGGGGPGGVTELTVPASEFNATETVTVGAGGTSGAGRTGSSGAGSDGGNGGTSSITVGGSTNVSAVGGLGGSGGAAGVGGAGGGVGTVFGHPSHVNDLIAIPGFLVGSNVSGGTGADPATPAAATVGDPSPFGGPGGGGGGGGRTAANAVQAAAAGGTGASGYGATGGITGGTAGTGGASNTAGGAGTAITSILSNTAAGGAGGGGGGEAGNSGGGGAGANGGNGGIYGGGGGGGGAGFGGNGGNGGVGGSGCVEVISYR